MIMAPNLLIVTDAGTKPAAANVCEFVYAGLAARIQTGLSEERACDCSAVIGIMV